MTRNQRSPLRRLVRSRRMRSAAGTDSLTLVLIGALNFNDLDRRGTGQQSTTARALSNCTGISVLKTPQIAQCNSAPGQGAWGRGSFFAFSPSAAVLARVYDP